jgi:hypothetical protein
MFPSSSLVFSLWAAFWQEPDPSRATGMALARSILSSQGLFAIAFPRR